jgi:hypothetical protein
MLILAPRTSTNAAARQWRTGGPTAECFCVPMALAIFLKVATDAGREPDDVVPAALCPEEAYHATQQTPTDCVKHRADCRAAGSMCRADDGWSAQPLSVLSSGRCVFLAVLDLTQTDYQAEHLVDCLLVRACQAFDITDQHVLPCSA